MSRRRFRWGWLVALGLVAAELTLQAVAVGYRGWAQRTQASSVQEADYTILCLGDSITFGAGADPQDSYPRQLERLLTDRWPGRRIRVMNEGVPGMNTSEMLHRFPQRLREVQPALVLLMAGRHDPGNFAEVDFAVLDEPKGSWVRRATMRADHLCSHSRLYRLAKLLLAPHREAAQPASVAEQELEETLARLTPGKPLDDPASPRRADTRPPRAMPAPLEARVAAVLQDSWQERSPAAVQQLKHLGMGLCRAERFELASHVLQEVVELQPEDREALARLADAYIQQEDGKRLRRLCEQLIQRDPTDALPHVKLAGFSIRSEHLQAAEASARTAIALNPTSGSFEAYAYLAMALQGQSRTEEARSAYESALRLNPSNFLYPCNRWILWVLSGLYRAVGEIERARQIWREHFTTTQSLSALVEYGRMYRNPDEARPAMRVLLEEVRASIPRDVGSWRPHERLLELGVEHEAIEALTEANLERMIALAGAQRVRVGLLTYLDPLKASPFRVRWQASLVKVLRRIAARHPEVLLLDAAWALSPRFADPTENLFDEDKRRRPNARGYGLLARYVMDTLVAAGVLDSFLKEGS